MWKVKASQTEDPYGDSFPLRSLSWAGGNLTGSRDTVPRAPFSLSYAAPKAVVWGGGEPSFTVCGDVKLCSYSGK